MNLMNMLICIDIMKSEVICIFLNGCMMIFLCLDSKCRVYCDNLYGSINICVVFCEVVGKKINCYCYGYIW